MKKPNITLAHNEHRKHEVLSLWVEKYYALLQKVKSMISNNQYVDLSIICEWPGHKFWITTTGVCRMENYKLKWQPFTKTDFSDEIHPIGNYNFNIQLSMKTDFTNEINMRNLKSLRNSTDQFLGIT